MCINQANKVERSHHVSFMGRIYRHARKVLVRKVLVRKVLVRKVLVRKVLVRKVLVRKVLVRKVLVCPGQDLGGEAEDVAALVKDNADLVSKYVSIAEMPVSCARRRAFRRPEVETLGNIDEERVVYSRLGTARSRAGERSSNSVRRSRVRPSRSDEIGSMGRGLMQVLD